ncbi:MAG: hypothetical protein HY722_03240 [Planctomycetes bacterium]|nr:hypothetical protein [Planctomycetota bacterium]
MPCTIALGRNGEPPSVATVGAKAAAVSRLAPHLPVPEGFAITVRAFERYHGLKPVREVVAGVLVDTDRHRDGAWERLRACFLATPLPAGLDGELARAARALGTGLLAVRSSAVEEDGEGRSAAGLMTSVLGVAPEDLGRALREVWASCFLPRAMAYRRRGCERSLPRPGALVQRLVAARAAGVCFTLDPANGDPERFVVEALPGLGGPAAGGDLTPDRFVLDRVTGLVLERRLVEKPWCLWAGAAEVSRRDLAGEERTRASLAESDLAAVGRLAARVERRWGRPVDLEWALEGEKVWLLQARPVTGVRVRPGPAPERWTRANAQEALPEPVTPMTWSLLVPPVEAGRRAAFRALGLQDPPGRYLELFRGRPYFNLTYFRAVAAQLPGFSDEMFETLIFGEDPGEDVRFLAPSLRPGYLRLLGLAVVHGLLAPRRVRRFLAGFEKELRRREALPTGRLDGLMELAEQALRVHVLGTAVAAGAYLVLDAALRRWAADTGLRAAALLTGTGGFESTRVSEALWDLGRACRADPEAMQAVLDGPTRPLLDGLPESHPFRAAFRSFLATYGHRAAGEAELATPRWSEDPRVPLAAVARYRTSGPEADPRRRATLAGEAAWRQAHAAARVAGGTRGVLLLGLVRVARSLMPLREDVKFHALRALAAVRRVLLEEGDRLATRGLLARPDDVFYLELPELAADGVDLARLVTPRRARREEERREEPPPLRVLPGTAGAPANASPTALCVPGSILVGLGASAGRYSGRVRVCHEVCEAALLEPGEVLVAPQADPGWTPAFAVAGAVVLDVGGVLSHAAVIARELGVPCVVGTRHACRALRTGDRVEVDGARGRVRTGSASAATPLP